MTYKQIHTMSFFGLFLLLCVTGGIVARADDATRPQLLLQEGDIVALCGDSITSNGTYPVFLDMYQLLCSPAQSDVHELRTLGRSRFLRMRILQCLGEGRRRFLGRRFPTSTSASGATALSSFQ